MKPTFANLDPAKKNIVAAAIREEFRTYPFDKASVKRIVERAEIPRGSFYQYFSELKEAYFFVLDSCTADVHLLLLELLKKHGGEIRTALEVYGERIGEEIFREEAYSLYRNRYLYWTEELEAGYEAYRKREHPEMPAVMQAMTGSEEEPARASAHLNGSEEMIFAKAVVHDLIRRVFCENWKKEEFLEKYRLHCRWIFGGIGNERIF